MKLGLVIKITNGGVAEAMSINKDESWARYIPNDVRLDINVLDNYDGTEKTVYLAKFLGSAGYFVALIKTAPKGSTNWRNWDNTAAWIHVPATCEISNSDIITVLQNVETAISASKGIDTELLDQIFNRNYNANDVLLSAVGTIVSNNDADYGIRYYNKDYTLKELLGISIAQQEYSNYKGIFFIDSNNDVTSSCKELNFEPLTICQYAPPTTIDGFTPCFLAKNNQYLEFNKSVEVPVGTPISIYWHKKGYAIVKKTFVAQVGPSCPQEAIIKPMEYKVIISKKLFHVVDHDGVPIKNYTLSVNHQVMDGESLEVSESLIMQGIQISVHANGYIDSQETIKGIPQGNTITIEMKERLYHYEFAISIIDKGKNKNNDAVLSIESQDKITSSPIKGYIAERKNIIEGSGRQNRLIWEDRLFSKLKYMAYGFFSCILLIALFVCYNILENDWSIGPKGHSDDSSERIDSIPENNTIDSLSLAIQYLNQNETWNKDELDKYPDTRGLFDDLNNFRTSNMERRYIERLSESSRLKNVLDALKENSKNGYDPHKGKEKNGGKYNSEGDLLISTTNYIVWLETDHSLEDTPKVSTNQNSKITGQPINETNKGSDLVNKQKGDTKEKTTRRGGEK